MFKDEVIFEYGDFKIMKINDSLCVFQKVKEDWELIRGIYKINIEITSDMDPKIILTRKIFNYIGEE